MGSTRSKPAPPAAGPATEDDSGQVRMGSQTLFRGLDVMEVVANGPVTLAELASRLGLTRSTTHRLASALVDRRYLTFVHRTGYSLGPKLLELGFRVRDELDLPRIAGPHLERLALLTEDTVHLGVLDRGRVLYLDKIPGRRRIALSSRIGETQPVASTGLGKALILASGEAAWSEFFHAEKNVRRNSITHQEWMARMRSYVQGGYTLDLEENEDEIRCVAAPIRNVEGRIIAAISVTSTTQHMSHQRLHAMAKDVMQTAGAISKSLGWSEAPASDATASQEGMAKAVASVKSKARAATRRKPKK